MPRQLLGTAIAANTITTTQLQTTIVNNITQGGGPRVTSLVYPGNDTAANTVGGQTVYVLGSGFASNAAVYINGNSVPSVSFISASNIAITTPALSSATYPIYVINPETGATAIFVPGLIISGEPSWVTSAGSLSSSQDELTAWSYTLSANGDAPITYALAAGSSLPTGISLAANGVISGTLSSPPGTETTYTFSVVASDAQNQDSTRQFTVTTSTGEGALFANNVLLIHADGTNNGNNHAFIDSSASPITITRNGNSTQGSYSPFSQTGWSAYFDGTGDYLSVGDQTAFEFGSGNYTVEFWWYPTSSADQNIVGKWDAGGSEWILQWRSAGYYRWASGGSVVSDATTTLVLNRWNHVAVTKSGTSLRIYTNGSQIGTTATESSISATGAALTIGAAQLNSSPAYVPGYISNLRILKGTAQYTGSTYTVPTSPLTTIANTSLLTCHSNRFKTDGDSYAIVNAKVYSTYNGGTRSNNYTVQYSDDNVSWTTAFSGVMEAAGQCGLITGTGGGGNYGSHKYWKYVVGTAVTQHHPRASKIVLTDSNGVDHTVTTFTSDNCSDSGTIPANGDSYILSRDFTVTRNGDTNIQAFSPFAPSAAYSAANNGGTVYFDGASDWLSMADNSAFDLGISQQPFTMEWWMYNPSSVSGWQIVLGRSGGAGAWNSSTGWQYHWYVNNSNALGVGYYNGSSYTYLDYNIGYSIVGRWAHIAISYNGTTLSFYVDGTRIGSTTVTNFTKPSSSIYTSLGSGQASGEAYYLNGYISGFRIVKGNAVYDPSVSTLTVPTSPGTAVTNTKFLLSATNANIFDQTGKNVLETVGDAKVSTSVYKYGTGSIAFDGTGDYLTMPNSDLLHLGSGNFTIEFWVYFSAFSDGKAVLSKGWSSINSPFLFYTDGVTNAFKFYSSSNGSTWDIANGIAVINSPSLNTWYHVAVTRDGSAFRTFSNGTQTANVTSSATLYSTTQPVTIGAGSGGSNGFNGYIDDFRITKGYARYTSNFTPPTSALKDK